MTPRTSCVYCGVRLTSPPWVACEKHRGLLALDHLSPPVDGSVDDSGPIRVYVPPMQAANGEAVQTREGTGSR